MWCKCGEKAGIMLSYAGGENSLASYEIMLFSTTFQKSKGWQLNYGKET